jgi:membrane protease subunit HflK
MYLDTVQQMMSNTSKVLVDQKGGNSLLYLPLDKLIQSTGAGPGLADAPPVKAPEAVAPAVESTARSREAFRSREREVRP